MLLQKQEELFAAIRRIEARCEDLADQLAKTQGRLDAVCAAMGMKPGELDQLVAECAAEAEVEVAELPNLPPFDDIPEPDTTAPAEDAEDAAPEPSADNTLAEEPTE